MMANVALVKLTVMRKNSMKQQLAALFLVQQQDSKIDALKRRFSLLDSGKEDKVAYDAAEATHKKGLEALHRASGELKDAELEQKQTETKQSDFEKKLYSGKVTNPKELQSMQDEVEMLGRLKVKQDDRILELIEAVDKCKAENKVTLSALKASRASLADTVSRYQVDAQAIRDEAQAIVAGRGKLAAEVPPMLLKRYEAMRPTKAGVAIVGIEDGNSCGGCKMALPSGLVTLIRAGEGIQLCQNCGRMLAEGLEPTT